MKSQHGQGMGSKFFGAVIPGLLGLLAVCVVAAILVWLLWYFATVHTNVYTALSVLGIAGAVVYFLVDGIRRKNAGRGRDH
jgi:hypothetical protein